MRENELLLIGPCEWRMAATMAMMSSAGCIVGECVMAVVIVKAVAVVTSRKLRMWHYVAGKVNGVVAARRVDIQSEEKVLSRCTDA